MNGTPLPQILQKVRLHWYHNYWSVMQRFLEVTFSYQTANCLEFKLLIMTKSKTKTKVILMEPIKFIIEIFTKYNVSKFRPISTLHLQVFH